jgi:hypothetical protein
LGFAFLAVGLWSAWNKWPRPLFAATVAAFCSSSFLLLLAWRWEFNTLTANVYSVYHLIPYGVAALWIGQGFSHFAEMRPGWWAPVTAAVLVVLTVTENYPINNLHGDLFANDFARVVLESLPSKSVLILSGDTDAGPIEYAQLIDGIRPDVVALTQFGAVFPERMYDTREVVGKEARGLRTANYIRQKLNEGYRVFTTFHLVYDQIAPLVYVSHGLYDEIRGEEGGPLLNLELGQRVLGLLDRIRSGAYNMGQWSFYRNVIVGKYCQAVIENHLSHPLLNESTECRLAQARYQANVEHQYVEAQRLFATVMQDYDAMPFQQRNGVYMEYINSQVMGLNGMTLTATERTRLFQETIDRMMSFVHRYPVCENEVALNLLEIRAHIPVNLDLNYFIKAFAECPVHRKRIGALHELVGK